MADRITAPWTEEQVAALTRWQNNPMVHPHTCAKRDGHPVDPEGDHGVLVATTEGWKCRHCDYTQDWALAMCLEDWPDSIDQVIRNANGEA